jgi:phosphoglycerate dehydrogenase-like enzyme
MAEIAVAGPSVAAAFLHGFGESLRTLGHTVTVECSDVVRLTSLPSWPRTDLLVCAGAGCSREAMVHAPSLRAIVSPVIGIDGIDVAAASERGVLVVNGQVPENANSMAEATIMLMLVCLYDLHGSEQRGRLQHVPAPRAPSARMLKGKKVGILGYGSIAKAVIARLSHWGAEILVHTRRPPVAVASTPPVVFDALERVLRESDVLLVLMTLTPETFHFLSAERLALMKRDAILVNTSRGAIVDEHALASLVAQGHLTGVALDVFEVEPLPASSPLRNLANAVLTPHCVGHTRESQGAIPPYALRNVQTLLSGELPASVCNPDAVPAWKKRWQPLQ